MDASPRGAFITLEGIDGCGKSTQLALLRDALLGRGLRVGLAGAPGATVREPGGTALGESIRDQLLHHHEHMDAWAEALLYAAARAQLARDVLAPSLAAGCVVLLDRYIDSSLAYQGYARGLGIEAVLDLNLRVTVGLLPALTLVLEVDPATAAARRTAPPDRIEREGDEFQARVAEGYRLVAARFPERVHLVDGARPAEVVAADVLALSLAALGHV